MKRKGEQTRKFVFEGERGGRLDAAIAAELARTAAGSLIPSRSQIKLWIEAGGVLVNGKTVEKAGAPLQPGSTITFAVPEEESDHLAAHEFPLSIVFEDEQLIVIDKPANLSMHPGAGNKTTTLVNALVGHFQKAGSAKEKRYFSSGERPGVVHRLDKDTSGLVVVAKSTAVHHALAEQFADRRVERAYLALVSSTPRYQRIVGRETEGVIETRLGRSSKDRKIMAVLEKGGKIARTRWQLLDKLGYACLVRLSLETGRTHQIRVHMKHVHAPIIGDLTYGDIAVLPKPLRTAAEQFGRQALHAGVLGFEHPLRKERLHFESPLPKDMQALIAIFRANSEIS